MYVYICIYIYVYEHYICIFIYIYICTFQIHIHTHWVRPDRPIHDFIRSSPVRVSMCRRNIREEAQFFLRLLVNPLFSSPLTRRPSRPYFEWTRLRRGQYCHARTPGFTVWTWTPWKRGGPEPLEKESHEFLGSKRDDRFSNPFFWNGTKNMSRFVSLMGWLRLVGCLKPVLWKVEKTLKFLKIGRRNQPTEEHSGEGVESAP